MKQDRSLSCDLAKTVDVKTASLEETNIVSNQTNIEKMSNKDISANQKNLDDNDLINKTFSNSVEKN